MVQITSTVEKSFIKNGSEVVEFRVPAISESRARSNALFSARLKGMDEPEITEVEQVGSSGIPGRKLYSVTVEAIR